MSEKNQARSLNHYPVMLVLGHQSVSQSVSQSGSPIGRKFCGNLLKAFRINPKAYFGLVLPALSSSGNIGAGFLVMFFLWATPTPFVVPTI